jgi:phosphohistidine swiveling domain-containing protein
VFNDFIVGPRRAHGTKEWTVRTRDLSAMLRACDRTDLGALSDASLERMWKKLHRVITAFWPIAVVPELGGYGGQALLKKTLQEIEPDPMRFLTSYATLAATARPSFYQEEEIGLARILRHADKTALQRALQHHATAYSWIGNSYYRSGVQPLSSFKERLDALGKRRTTATIMANKFDQDARMLSQAKRKILRSLPHAGTLRQLSDGVARCIWWQDERKKYIFQYVGTIDRLAREFERRAMLKPRTYDFAYYWEVKLRPTEAFLRELSRRSRWFATRLQGKGGADVSGARARRVVNMFWNIPKSPMLHELRGVPTYAAKRPVRGRVFIIRSHADLKRFPKGRILIAAMTAPEYVVAMRKASAIVTDTGGITSHAAIVSRELKKPCIVGTLHATRLLKTGDRVEVNANKGIIRKL